MNAYGAISAPVLTPVTTENSGRLPDSDQPLSRPAPNAPSPPPVESASHGPGVVGSAARKSFSESAQNRASGIPGTIATAWSSAVKSGRDGCSGCLAAASAAGLANCAQLLGLLLANSGFAQRSARLRCFTCAAAGIALASANETRQAKTADDKRMGNPREERRYGRSRRGSKGK